MFDLFFSFERKSLEMMNYFVRSFNVCFHPERNHCFTDTDSIDDYNISPIILRYLNFIY